MSEWSEYFEDVPEENPANYINGRFDPLAANAQLDAQRRAVRTSTSAQQRLDTEIAAIVQRHKKRS